MEKKISATEARIHFGELIRKVREENQPYVVEKSGEPAVVVLSYEEYARLKSGHPKEDWRENLEQALALGAEIRARNDGEPLPDAAEIIHQMREERTQQLMETIGFEIDDLQE